MTKKKQKPTTSEHGSVAIPVGLELVKISELVPYERNARTHSDHQVEQIAASMKEFGFTNPILIDDDLGVIAGHGRMMAAQSVGLVEVPVVRLSHLTPTQRRAYVLADNQLALNAGWDTDLLPLELGELFDAGFNVDLLGFDEKQVASMLATEGETDPDDVPEVQPSVVTREGDVWVMGKHRVICGDSTSADVVDRLLDGREPGIMVTDPPYGVEYDPNWRIGAGVNDPDGDTATGKVQNDDRVDWGDAWSLFSGAVAYVWHSSLFTGDVAKSMQDAGLRIRSVLIWSKNRIPMSRGHYHWKHEPCIYAARKGTSAQWCGGRKQNTIWEINIERCDTGHGTQKPVECMERPIRNHEFLEVYDPFLGSGTTIIAAEKLGRACYGCELSPKYVDVIVRRWEAFTGSNATLERDGRTFKKVEGDGGQ